jgi:acyl-CoA thioester hydrolase
MPEAHKNLSRRPRLLYGVVAPMTPQEFTLSRRVEFRDTDAAGIMHFSVFFLYMEEAEHEFLRSVGLSVFMEEAGNGQEKSVLTWPRVRCECDYFSPAKFEQELQIRIRIIRLGEKSVTYRAHFSHQDREVAAGTMTAVCCRIHGHHSPHPVPIPDDVRAKLAPFVDPNPHAKAPHA